MVITLFRPGINIIPEGFLYLATKMKKLVVLTGSGISSESGLRTFREMGGLWEEYDVHEVASPQAWAKDMDLVLRFYNERRKQLHQAKPNAGHTGLAELEKYFDVEIITQNVDDLHERAGSSKESAGQSLYPQKGMAPKQFRSTILSQWFDIPTYPGAAGLN